MKYRPEPAYRHGEPARTAVLLVNLGTPEQPTAAALRRYLAQFLADPRVVEIPRPLWWLILHGIILRTRPAKSAAKYAAVWTPEGSPLMTWTVKQAKLLGGTLGERGHQLIVRPAMRYGEPAVARVLDELKAEGVRRVLVLPLYPQYAAATTASVVDAVADWARATRHLPELRFVMRFHDDPGYIAALAQRVIAHWRQHGRSERLMVSFHGVPRRSLDRGDPYHCECHKTARLLAERLGLPSAQVVVAFQSRFGRARWLEPYTEPTLRQLAAQGVRRVDVICPGFVSDCVETLEEIAIEAKAAFLSAGGQEFHYIDCLNDRPEWIGTLADLAVRHLQGWDTTTPPDARLLAAQRERAKAMGAPS
jgi:ferrochelatase